MHSKEKNSKTISRRDFFKGSALAAVGVAAGGLLAGCGKSKKTEDPAKETKAGGKAGFEVPPAPIADKDIKKTISADVVVVGAGMSGLCAALSAAETGAKVVVLEKRETFSARGMHIAAIGTKTQEKYGVTINKKQGIRDIIKWSGSRVKQELHWLWANKSGEAMNWLTAMTEAEGYETTLWAAAYKGPDYYEYPGITHTVLGPSFAKYDNNHDVLAVLEKHAKEKGVNFQYQTQAAQLVRPDKGRVTAVIGKNAAGYTKFEAKSGVILCCGDYAADQEMVDRYCPLANKVEAKIYTPVGANTGDGHKLGLWAGAAMQKDEPHAAMIHTQAGAWSYCFLHVNKNGERYSNEDATPQAVCMAKMEQPDRVAWAVYDDRFLDELPKTVEIGGGMFWDQVARTWGHPWSRESEERLLKRHLDAGLVVKADTLDELAQKMQVPADKLKATVARYNELAKNKEDVDFGKRSELLFPIDKPPFYAGQFKSALLTIVGGLSINNKMQVLDQEDNAIPGLYAAGNTAGDFFGNDYPTLFPGHSHGRCITFGRLAGLNAAADKV
ncbi:FAD-dependent oxidoreductase [Sporomusa acidovorans]|uniref:Fumarate reductase flavoprotein subunit n=1 Tax=Sporomusa acidovorans (strain ATCC 49682 / DSM 3132 / Mol) TaxID=1123286 RepID=A0ABZ3J044_SPOA4|nr:FAD-dependent oxidoreductase [Sporomusa acidovorans]OZC21337.1 fumarate reductase flavoprotein subunit precursor [Sporomusa acidovorans DSM 3132]SDE56988.1 Tat (twin-arginine translocation) pathway signal sequence [Sporomusa acidovorans]